MKRKGKIKYAVGFINVRVTLTARVLYRKVDGTWQKIGRAHTSLRVYNSTECILIISYGGPRRKRGDQCPVLSLYYAGVNFHAF